MDNMVHATWHAGIQDVVELEHFCWVVMLGKKDKIWVMQTRQLVRANCRNKGFMSRKHVIESDIALDGREDQERMVEVNLRELRKSPLQQRKAE